MSDKGYNILGAVAGVLGIMGLALVPIVWGLIKCQMPSEKLRVLNALLLETAQQMVRSANDRFPLIMWTTKCRFEKLRAKIYTSGRNWKSKYRNWKDGLSGRAKLLCKKLHKMQAVVARSSAKQRMRLAAEHHVATMLAQEDKGIGGAIPLATGPTPPQSDDSTKHPVVADAAMECSSETTDDAACAVPPHALADAPAPHYSSRTLSSPHLSEILGKRCYLSRRDVLVRFGRQLCDTGSHPYSEEHKPRATRSRLKQVACCICRGHVFRLQDRTFLGTHGIRTTTVIVPQLPYEDYDGDDESDG